MRSESIFKRCSSGRTGLGAACSTASLFAVLFFALPAAAADNVVPLRGGAATTDGIINEFMKGGQDGTTRQDDAPRIRMRGITIRPGGTVTAAPAPASANTGCPRTDTVVALDVKFDVNSAVLTSDAYRTLRQMADAMKRAELVACHFAIEGHTDASGAAAYNDSLSKRRANAVKEFLLSMDVSGNRLDTVGKGSREPLNPANPRAGENRRVQFRIVGSGN